MDGDVVDMIMQDHREVERLFQELKSAPDKRPLLVPTLTSLLVAHSRAEEAEVYPVARDEAGESEEVAHSQEEHAQAERLLAELLDCDYDSPQYDAKLREVVEAVTHHVEEEESTVLPGMRERLSHTARMKLARQFARSRREHMGEVPGEARKDHLVTQAHNAGLTVRSSASKDELTKLLAGKKA